MRPFIGAAIYPFSNTQLIQQLLYYSPMDETPVVRALAALAHSHRLRIFRALVVAGQTGLTPSDLATRLGIARNTLSFHLKELSHAQLIHAQAQGRNLIYRANFEQVQHLLAYLTEHCCQGQACVITAERSAPANGA